MAKYIAKAEHKLVCALDDTTDLITFRAGAVGTRSSGVFTVGTCGHLSVVDSSGVGRVDVGPVRRHEGRRHSRQQIRRVVAGDRRTERDSPVRVHLSDHNKRSLAFTSHPQLNWHAIH